MTYRNMMIAVQIASLFIGMVLGGGATKEGVFFLLISFFAFGASFGWSSRDKELSK